MKKTLEQRFWEKVDVRGPDECWEWKANTVFGGYGSISTGSKNKGTRKENRAHRVAYTLVHGPIPTGLNVLHSCDNPGCVNPAHLRADTQSENLKESFTKGRHSVPCSVGRNNAARRLSELTVQRLRILDRALPDHRVAAVLGVSKATIQAIMSRRNWKHLTNTKQALML